MTDADLDALRQRRDASLLPHLGDACDQDSSRECQRCAADAAAPLDRAILIAEVARLREMIQPEA